jgi:hypothetical protein
VKTIDPQIAAELYEHLDDRDGRLVKLTDQVTVDDWTVLGSTRVRSARWEEVYYLVLREDATGETWGAEYRIGLTENQSDWLPWNEESVPSQRPVPLVRLARRERTVVEYVKAAS